MAIKAIIVDDEIMARNLLGGMLEAYCPEVEVIEMCKDLPTAVLSIRKNKPDIVFLDIEMPGFSGLEILNFFGADEIDFSIVFTTSYNEYAVQAFKLSAIDYLLKPIESDDLIRAVDVYKKKQGTANYQQLKETLNTQLVRKIPIYTPSSIVYVELSQIMFMKAEGAYTKIFLTDGTTMLASKGLKHFEEMVTTDKKFMRTHKSYIANIDFVSELVKSNGGYLKIRNHEVNISMDKIPVFMELMKCN